MGYQQRLRERAAGGPGTARGQRFVIPRRHGSAHRPRARKPSTTTGSSPRTRRPARSPRATTRSFETLPAAEAPKPAPTNRSGSATRPGLPDCRVLEWVTPELNGAVTSDGICYASPDGNHLRYGTLDAPDKHRIRRNPFRTGVVQQRPAGLDDEVPDAADQDAGVELREHGRDRGAVRRLLEIGGPLQAAARRSGIADHGGSAVLLPPAPRAPTYRSRRTAITTRRHSAAVRPPGTSRTSSTSANRNSSRKIRSNRETPTNGQDGQLRLVGWLPAAGGHPEEPAPTGALYAAATEREGLDRLRRRQPGPLQGERRTGPVPAHRSQTQRRSLGHPAHRRPRSQPHPEREARSGSSDDGSKAVFESASELTNDANTGRDRRGAPTTAAPISTPTTSRPGNSPTSPSTTTPPTRRPGPTSSGSSATPRTSTTSTSSRGATWLRVGSPERKTCTSGTNGEIDYVAENPSGYRNPAMRSTSRPTGATRPFSRRPSPTAYDNVNPKTAEPMSMVFKYTYKGALECASCRPSGAPPTSGSDISGRAISDDGSKLFFDSSDAILPQSVNGLERVYEYRGVKCSLVSPPDAVTRATCSTRANPATTSSSRPSANSPRETGRRSRRSTTPASMRQGQPAPEPGCQGENCRGTPTSAQNTAEPGHRDLRGDGTGRRLRSRQVSGLEDPAAGHRSRGRQRVGRRQGSEDVKTSVSKAGSVTVTVTLTPGANKKRLRKGVFKTEAQVIFASSSGNGSRDEVPLKFKAGTRRRAANDRARQAPRSRLVLALAGALMCLGVAAAARRRATWKSSNSRPRA